MRLNPRLALLSFGHFTIDSYSSFFAPLLPLLVAKLGLSLTRVGLLVALSSLASSLAQPLFGLISDRMRHPWFIGFGPLTAALFISALGLAPTYGVLIALLMLGGLGVAAFHPQAASLAGEVSSRRSMGMALFVTGGTLGFSIGPLLAVGAVRASDWSARGSRPFPACWSLCSCSSSCDGWERSVPGSPPCARA
jgi:FSR family fosmidomycin resistance protein-like MFS transporter